MPYNIPSSLLYTYDDIFLGNADRFPQDVFLNAGVKKRERYALELIRFGLEKHLHWSPYEAEDHFSLETVNFLGLSSVLRFIDFPYYMSKCFYHLYILWSIYPKLKSCSYMELEVDMYDRFLNNTVYKLPSDFFSKGDEGIARCAACLLHCIVRYQPVDAFNIYSLYEFFSTNACIEFLKQTHLSSVIIKSFEKTPLEFFHEALDEKQRSDALLYYFTFINANTNYMKE